MAVTISIPDLRAALRLGDSAEETAEITRLHAYASEAVTRHAPDAVDVAHSEAVVRLVSYLFDQPAAARGAAFAHAGRNSGAWQILLPYRVHRAGSVAGATAQAAAAPSIGDPGVDQTARDAAAAAQAAAATAQDAADAAQVKADANVLPVPATNAEASGGVSTSIRSWTAALIRAAINAVVPTWARVGNTDAIPADKLTNAPAGGEGGALGLSTVGDWAETIGSRQGAYKLFDIGIALPAEGEIHHVRVIDNTNGYEGTVLIVLADLITGAIAGVPWADSNTAGTAPSAANARRYPLGQNRGYVLGKTASGNYLFGMQNHAISVSVHVDKFGIS